MLNNNFYWLISDGRIWGASEGAFVTPPEGFAIIKLPGESGGTATVDDLRETIVFYQKMGRSFPLGELATKLGRITAVQTKYAPDFAALDTAAVSAMIDGDQDVLTEIAAEKAALRTRMTAEIQTIQEEV